MNNKRKMKKNKNKNKKRKKPFTKKIWRSGLRCRP
jgi:hypothetical protein